MAKPARGTAAEAPPRSSSPRVVRKHNKRREGIVEAAAVVFGERGYHRTSLEDIAENLDLTRASLYHYFPSKDALLAACLDAGADQANTRLATVFEENSEQDADTRLAALIRTQLIIITREAPELSRLFLSAMDWPSTFRAQAKSLRDRHDGFFRDVIEHGIAAGEFQCADPVVARHCLHGALNYAAVWVRPRSPHYEATIDAVTRSLLQLFHVPQD